MFYSGLFLVDIEADLLVLVIGNALVALGGGNDDVLARAGEAEFLGEINLDCKDVAFDFHVYVLHSCSPFEQMIAVLGLVNIIIVKNDRQPENVRDRMISCRVSRSC